MVQGSIRRESFYTQVIGHRNNKTMTTCPFNFSHRTDKSSPRKLSYLKMYGWKSKLKVEELENINHTNTRAYTNCHRCNVVRVLLYFIVVITNKNTAICGKTALTSSSNDIPFEECGALILRAFTRNLNVCV